jgi:hypothetical protein
LPFAPEEIWMLENVSPDLARHQCGIGRRLV